MIPFGIPWVLIVIAAVFLLPFALAFLATICQLWILGWMFLWDLLTHKAFL